MRWAIYGIDKADTAPLRDQHMRSHLDDIDHDLRHRAGGALLPRREPYTRQA